MYNDDEYRRREYNRLMNICEIMDHEVTETIDQEIIRLNPDKSLCPFCKAPRVPGAYCPGCGQKLVGRN